MYHDYTPMLQNDWQRIVFPTKIINLEQEVKTIHLDIRQV